MEHKHGEGQHCCGNGCCGNHAPEWTQGEKAFLEKLAKTPLLEVAQLLMRSTKSEHFERIALAPVHLEGRGDTMEQVRQTAQALQALEEKGIIAIDYDTPVEGSDYRIYHESEIYRYLVSTLEEAAANPDFVFNVAHMECGSLALTELGQALLEAGQQ